MVHDNSLPLGDRDEDDNEHLSLRLALEHKTKETMEIVSQGACWAVAERNGWHNPPADLTTDLLLIHSEISEATEALRKGVLFFDNGNDSVEEELADAIIRIFHTAEKNGFDIAEAVRRKHEKNRNRPYRHGNKAF